LVVAGNGPSLFGKNWLQKIRLDWNTLIYKISTNSSDSHQNLHGVLLKHSEVFNEGLGLVKDYPADIHVNEDATPKFHKARAVPYALRDKVNADLDRLQQEGIIEPVKYSKWAAPIVPVIKPNGSLRICGDYKTTVNAASKQDKYPLPRIEDIFSRLEGGTTFSKLDLSSAFQQIPLNKDSRKYTTINTSKGLFQYTRLPFGICSAPSIFQRVMDSLLNGLPGVAVYIDDILVTGKTEDDHLQNLDRVLSYLANAGFRLNRSKCTFLLPDIQYLGHIISAEGIRPCMEKIQALQEAPTPTNIQQLRSFLGAVNYYRKFIPNLSSLLTPLNEQLQKDRQWSWENRQISAFKEAKQQLTSTRVLTHYDPKKPLLLSCDASPYGVGAVISHRLQDEGERPIAFASRTLNSAEKKYSQLDKEALSIIFGIKKFQQYLQGRHFTIISDHKPLQYLFGEGKPVPVLASTRIKRWALILSAHDYKIEHRPGRLHGNADVLSRLPLPETVKEADTPGEMVLLMDTLHSTPIDSQQIRRWTDRDPVMSKVRRLVQTGWKQTSTVEMKPYQERHLELSIQGSCVLWGDRVIIPTAGRVKILELLHDGHPGMTKMKQLARSVVWWPSITKDIEEKVKSCETCSIHQKSPPVAPMHPWEWPERPWTRLHIDYAGPFMDKMFLVIIDSHSKWLEVVPVSTANSTNTIMVLRNVFSQHGIPEVVVSDNGTAFTSSEFALFMAKNGIRHIRSAPYHPSTNGQAERAVQVFKNSMKKSGPGELQTKLARILFQYRTTPHSTTGRTPAELLMGRPLRTHLEMLKPDLRTRVENKQFSQKKSHDEKAKERSFELGNEVYVRTAGPNSTWVPGKIQTRRGSVQYEVILEDGRLIIKHVDHVQSRKPSVDLNPIPTSFPNPEYELIDNFPDPIPQSTPTEDTPLVESMPSTTNQPRRSNRVRRPPDRYGNPLHN
jgi:hypothetical protein